MNISLRKSRDFIEDLNAQAEDSLAGIRVVQSFTNQDMELKKFSLQNERFFESRKNVYKHEAYFFGGMGFFTQLMSLSVVLLGGYSIVQKTLDLADMMTFLMYIVILVEPIHKFSDFAKLFQEAITGFDRFVEALEVQPEIQDKHDAIDLGKAQGSIEFKNVDFKYKREHNFILNTFSLNIKAGEFVALIGVSGVGKTTLCSLIPRFYEIHSGEVKLDGHDIRKIRLQSLRRNIGIVQQDVYLFSGTVAENIRYGNLKAAQEDIIDAAKKANAHDFIMSLPQTYDTDIGQRGVKLSGGQKQRLSLARVFLKDAPVLIFDEATSALDNESERAVQESLEKLSKQRTTLVIAHRLSTVRKAHRIVVLTEQGIGEEGTHDELLARKGLYAKLYNRREE
jgi:ATP-binding cassette subfamily B protein